jgi:hypothetical protein
MEEDDGVVAAGGNRARGGRAAAAEAGTSVEAALGRTPLPWCAPVASRWLPTPRPESVGRWRTLQNGNASYGVVIIVVICTFKISINYGYYERWEEENVEK